MDHQIGWKNYEYMKLVLLNVLNGSIYSEEKCILIPRRGKSIGSAKYLNNFPAKNRNENQSIDISVHYCIMLKREWSPQVFLLNLIDLIIENYGK